MHEPNAWGDSVLIEIRLLGLRVVKSSLIDVSVIAFFSRNDTIGHFKVAIIFHNN